MPDQSAKSSERYRRTLTHPNIAVLREQLEYLQNEVNGNRGVQLVREGRSYGRVEVFYNSVWGTMCDDGGDLNAVRVICRMLGYEDALCSSHHAI